MNRFEMDKRSAFNTNIFEMILVKKTTIMITLVEPPKLKPTLLKFMRYGNHFRGRQHTC
jgi:hypothetical protein